MRRIHDPAIRVATNRSALCSREALLNDLPQFFDQSGLCMAWDEDVVRRDTRLTGICGLPEKDTPCDDVEVVVGVDDDRRFATELE